MPGWALYRLLRSFIARLDDLSHCLAWAVVHPGADGAVTFGQYGNHNAAMEATNLPVDLLEFPRLNLKFRVKKVDGVGVAGRKRRPRAPTWSENGAKSDAKGSQNAPKLEAKMHQKES